MEKQAVDVYVEQKVNYAQTDHSDRWEHSCQGYTYILSTYQKIIYRDQLERKIEVKWQTDDSKKVIDKVKINQGKQTLIFNTKHSTTTNYQSEQGVLLLEIRTHKIDYSKTADGQMIQIHYQMHMNDQSLGDYFYQLKISS
ncbi:DUF1934 domain-containing protein [Facklamia sp. 7083-14-GEN3]|uniref:DUF1934 domain-containing protein n=1 Tax=Facklamia sp. 7083-14-GEN3 TaxID=2973478 RepID=UPI00215CBAD9|nr:DUF1934 domain-containing protein [Facklamia sp. 7083-14-GEN3]MCR8969952.1 DUF1934 domain-containing protein [Facklamia sp. 7083-14-GEN3]